MHTRCIQWILAACDTRESCTLLKRLRSELRNLEKLTTALKPAVLLTIRNDIFRDRLADTGNILQKRCRRRIQIHTNLIYTVLNNSTQCLTKLLLVHIMLILSDTDRLRCDLNELCKRILKTSCDGSRTSLSHIKVRKLLCCQLARGIYRSTRLVCDHILNFLRDFLKQFHNDLLRLPGRCSISKRNKRNIVFPDQFLKCIFCRLDLLLIGRCCRIDHCRIQHFSGRIYDCQLASCTECRVPAEDNFAYDRRLHQKLLKVFSKDMDRTVLSVFCQAAADLPLDCRGDQTLVAVLYHFTENRCCDRIILCQNLLLQPAKDFFLRCIYLDCEDFFLLTTVQGKYTMSGELLDRLFEFIVHLIYRRLFRFLRCRCNRTFFHGKVTDIDSIICLIRNRLCQNILRSVQRVLYGLYAFFLRKKSFSFLFQRFLCHLKHDDIRQRLKSFFLRNDRSCTSLRTVWTIKVLYYYEGLGIQNLLLQFRCQFALLFNACKYLIFLIFQISQVKKSFVQGTELLIVQRACRFFTITGNKRDRTSLIDQLYSSLYLPFLYFKFVGYHLNNIHK